MKFIDFSFVMVIFILPGIFVSWIIYTVSQDVVLSIMAGVSVDVGTILATAYYMRYQASVTRTTTKVSEDKSNE
jgi:hypothetical protein